MEILVAGKTFYCIGPRALSAASFKPSWSDLFLQNCQGLLKGMFNYYVLLFSHFYYLICWWQYDRPNGGLTERIFWIDQKNFFMKYLYVL